MLVIHNHKKSVNLVVTKLPHPAIRDMFGFVTSLRIAIYDV